MLPQFPEAEYESGDGGLLDEAIPDYGRKRAMAITLSPPMRKLPFVTQIYIDLRMYRDYINDETLEVYPEFEKGRLHYHCIFCPKVERYGHDYEFWVIHSGPQRIPFTLKRRIGVTKDGKKIKYKKMANGIYKCMNYVKFNNVDYYDWLLYCLKNETNTREILGYSKIDKETWANIAIAFNREYNVEMI